MSCVLTSITMDCKSWVIASSKEEDGGFKNWANGTKVAFWWFDGRDISGTKDDGSGNQVAIYPEATYPKIKTASVDLVFDSTDPNPGTPDSAVLNYAYDAALVLGVLAVLM